jgi:Rad3-related DNA helicase
MNKNKSLAEFRRYLDIKGWTAREYQEESIEKICDYFDDGAKMVVYVMPTGGGKTIVNMAAAAGCESAYYVVCNLSLQDQILGDFECVGDIRGRKNYGCSMIDTQCDDGLCQRKKGFKCEAECEYKSAKEEAIGSRIVLTNIWYWILEGGRSFGKRELLIIDEGHNISEMLVQFSRVMITARGTTAEIYDNALKLFDEFGSDTRGFLEAVGEEIEVVSEVIGDKDDLDDRDIKLIKRLGNLEIRLQNCLLSGDMVVNQEKWWIEVVPLKPKAVAEKLLFSRADKVLITSATVNPYHIVDELDTRRILGEGKVAHFSVPSTFPPEHRKIFLMPVCKFTYKNQTLDNIMKIEDAVVKIMDKYPDDKGLIFCQGYRYMEMLEGITPRILTHDKTDRKKIVSKWKSGFGNEVLAGIKMEEGEDLKDDMSRFSIVFKNPIPNTLDIRVKARIEKGEWNWLYRMAQCTLMQAAGRIVRSERDYGDMWVLDESACKLFKRKGIPGYIKDSLADVNYKDWDKGIEEEEFGNLETCEICVHFNADVMKYDEYWCPKMKVKILYGAGVVPGICVGYEEKK